MMEQHASGPSAGRDPERGLRACRERRGQKLLSEEMLSSETYWQKFRTFSYEEADGPRQVCTQLHHLCHQWLKPEQHTKAEILDLVILEQFLAVLPLDVSTWVRKCGAETTSQAVSLAEVFLSLSQEEDGKPGDQEMRNSSEEIQSDFQVGEKSPFHTRPSPQQQDNEEGVIFIGAGGIPETRIPSSLPCDAAEPDQGTCREKAVYLNSGKTLAHKCIVCGKYYTRKTTLMLHQRIHTGKKEFVSEVTGKCFNWMQSFVNYERLHTGQKHYKCQGCVKGFAQNSHLVKHERSHTGKKHYKGQGCGKCFAQDLGLLRHKRVHTGEKFYKCQECGKCFARNSHLVKHKRVHTGEKPYKCQECGKCFAHNSDLVKHKRVHRGVISIYDMGQNIYSL